MTKNYKLEWKKYNGHKINNVAQYVKTWSDNNPHGQIIIGCDSQVHRKCIKYSVSICLHMIDENKIGHGAHVIFANHFDTNKALRKDVMQKLWVETLISMEAAEEVKSLFTKDDPQIEVHLDYNSDPQYYSNSLYKNGIGIFEGMGYKAYGKPYAFGASHASDALCKNKQAKGIR